MKKKYYYFSYNLNFYLKFFTINLLNLIILKNVKN